MSIYQLKNRFQQFLRPICRFLAGHHISANQITLAALALSIIEGAWLWARPDSPFPLLLLPAVLFIRMALNAIDGMLAREHGMSSPLGAFLNELGDVFSDVFLYLPFAMLPGMPGLQIFLFVLLAVISEMTGVTAVLVGSSRHYEGPMGKSDRAFVFGALGLGLGRGLSPGLWTSILFICLNLLLLRTIWNRVQCALKEIS